MDTSAEHKHTRGALGKYVCGLLALLLLLCGGTAAWAGDSYSVTVDTSNRIDVQITDGQGHALAPGQPIGNISYVVKSQPEGAKVAVYTANDSQLENEGKLTVGFSCDMAGTVELEVLVRLRDTPRYYTDTLTIEVEAEQEPADKIVILSIGSRQIIVNDGVVQCDVAPEIQNDRTYVPLRALSDIFEAQCDYNTESRQVTITKDEQVITMIVDAAQYTLNDEERVLDAPAYVRDGRTMVPVRFIAEAFGAVVKPTYDETGAVADVMFQL